MAKGIFNDKRRNFGSVILPFEPLSEPKNLKTITAQPLEHDVRFRRDTSAQVTSRWVGRVSVSLQPYGTTIWQGPDFGRGSPP